MKAKVRETKVDCALSEGRLAEKNVSAYQTPGEHVTPQDGGKDPLLEGGTGYCDMFFPFVIHQEHRLSVQAVVLAGVSLGHKQDAVLK